MKVWHHTLCHCCSLYRRNYRTNQVHRSESLLRKEFPKSFGIWRLIAVFTTTCLFFAFSVRWIQSRPSTQISLKSILTLSSLLRLGLQSCFFPSVILTKKLIVLPLACHMSCLFDPPWLDNVNNIWWEVHVIMLFIIAVQFISTKGGRWVQRMGTSISLIQ